MKTRWRLTKEEKLEIAFLYIFEGWNLYQLARKFNIMHQSVCYYVQRYELERKKPKLKAPPEEIKHFYIKKPMSYKDYLRQDKLRK